MNRKSMLSILGLTLITLYACQKDQGLQSNTAPNEIVLAASSKPTAAVNCANYGIALNVDKTTMPGKTIFTWTITNPNPGNGSGITLQDLSHWSFIPSACLLQYWNDIFQASYNNGSGWVVINPLPELKPDPSLNNAGCNSEDVFKFDYGTSGSTPTQYRIVMLGNWGTGPLSVYYKSGKNTGCCRVDYTAQLGIGCPEQDELCSFSQGYWFANNWKHPNGVHPWPNDVTIGGYTYTNAEGLAIWNASNAPGGIKDAKQCFTQLTAFKMSGAATADETVLAAINTIENWLANYGAKLSATNLRNQTSAEKLAYGDANTAANTISQWINNNHCSDE